MTPHDWTIEEVDGGHVGTGDFFKCQVCGGAGGPVLTWPPPRTPTWAPFLAGTGLSLSDDCLEARSQIRTQIRQQCRKLRVQAGQSPERHHWSLIYDAIGWTPEINDVTPVRDLMGLIQYHHAYGKEQPSFQEVRKTLQDLGYCLMPEELGKAIKELGEAIKREDRDP